MEEHRLKFTAGAMEARVNPRRMPSNLERHRVFLLVTVLTKHAADYAVITCQTAFLKAHYPVEYVTALLSVRREKRIK